MPQPTAFGSADTSHDDSRARMGLSNSEAAMYREMTLAATLLACGGGYVAAAAEPAHSGGAGPAACHAITDAKGDGTAGPAGAASSSHDIEWVDHAIVGEELRSTVKLAAMEDSPEATGDRVSVSFSVGEKAITQFAVRQGSAPYPLATGTASAGTTATWSPDKDVVVLAMKVAEAEKTIGVPLAGATLTKLGADVKDAWDGMLASWDSAMASEYVMGACEAAAATKMAVTAPAAAPYSDAVNLVATLTRGDGTPLSGKEVAFTLATLTGRGVTGADGVARARIVMTRPAGSYELTAAYAGDAAAPAASAKRPFRVVAEKTVLTATGAKGTVTATLADDDRQRLAGQPVMFTVGSKTTTVKTNAQGVAQLAGQKPGTAVGVSYAGAAGKYAGCRSSAKA